MLATLGGTLALLLGLALLTLPVLLPELSRPRDAAWGAVVLLLGLVLVTSADRLTGAPMLGVLCGALLIGRLAVEVGQGRWYRLTPEERLAIWSRERWQTARRQLGETAARLASLGSESLALARDWIHTRSRPPSTGKRWVRPEQPASAAPGPMGEDTPSTPIPSLDAVDALLDAAQQPPDDGAG
ncbi:MAG: Ycf66 family protein [Cyanobacteriota bacterium]|nr:Ycf66 family protein [Cyanobacteriota bacterium]